MTSEVRASSGLTTGRVQRWSDASGARVSFVARDALPIIDLSLDFDAGSRYDPLDRAGVGELLRSILFTGARAGAGRPALNESAFEAAFDEAGAQLSVDISADCLSIGLRCLAHAPLFDAALSALCAGLAAPVFGARIVERERERLLASIEEDQTLPERAAETAFAKALYAGHPLGAVADAASVERIERADLARFVEERVRAQALSITLVGALDSTRAQEVAATLIAAVRRRGAGPKSDQTEDIVLPRTRARRIDIACPASQTHVLAGLATPGVGGAGMPALSLANRIFSWRLMQEMREAHGLAYEISSMLTQAREGTWRIVFSTQREQAERALALMHQTLERFLEQGPGSEEFERIRAEMINGYPLGFDSNAKVLRQVANAAFYRLPDDALEAWPAQLAALSLAQTHSAFASAIEPERLITVTAG